MVRRSLRMKLTLVLTGLLLGCVLLQGVLQSSKIEQQVLRSTRLRLLAQTRQLVVVLGQVPWSAATDRDTTIRQVAAEGDARITLFDAAGNVIADSVQPATDRASHSDRPELQAAWSEGEGWAVRYSESLQQMVLYAAVRGLHLPEGPVVVRMALPLDVVQEVSSNLWMTVISAVLITSALGIGVAVWLARSLTQPIEQITRVAKQTAAGDLSQRVQIERQDELGVLAESFNQLARVNEKRYRQIVAAKEQSETIIRHTVSGIFLLDAKGTVLLSNPSAARMLGFDEDDLPMSLYRLDISGSMIAALEQAMQQSYPFRQDVSIDCPAERVLELNVTPLVSEERYVAVFYDVSESRHLDAIRTDLVANVSHELKTPLTSIHGFAETLLQGALDEPDTSRHFVEIIYRESRRLLLIVSDLLDLSRLELDTQAIEKKPVDLIAVLSEAMERQMLEAEKKEINLRLVVGVEEAIMLGDEYRLEQAVGNLIDNALKYTPAGGEVRLNLQYEKGGFLITVRDTGVGIEPEHLGRVFERFYRTDKARSRRRGGTGLGLSIVKHVVELHGGQVWAESQVGSGSAFHIHLPVAEGETTDSM